MLEGKCILITGASSGVGRHFAEYAAAQGSTLVLVARRQENLEEIQKRFPDQCHIFCYDLDDIGNIKEIFDFVKDNGLKLDGLVHCAGVGYDVPIRVLEAEQTANVMRVNTLSFVQLGKYFSMKKYSHDGSSIVAISSMAAFGNPKGMLSYNISKTALHSAIATMAKEFLSRKVRVNGIAPGFIDTPMAKGSFENIVERKERFSKQQPWGIIPPQQISYLVEFLLSERAEYITGAVVPVSGGDLLERLEGV